MRRTFVEPALAVGALFTVAAASACAGGQSVFDSGNGGNDASGSTGSDVGIGGPVSSDDGSGQSNDGGAAGDDSTFAMGGGNADADIAYADAAAGFTDAEAGTGSDGGAAGAFDADDSGPPAAGLSALYAVGTSAATSAYVGCEIAVQNSAAAAVPVSSLVARYYFTDEVHLPPQITIQWSHISTSGPDVDLTVTTTVASLSPAVVGADTHIDFAFSSSHSMLGRGESAVFSWQMNGPAPDKDVYTQTNDYSFSASKAAPPTPWDHVVLLQNGSVVWGKQP